MSDDKVCEKSPDKKHHYEMSMSQHMIYVHNGSHTCYICHFCTKTKCVTTHRDAPNPLELPTDEDFDNK